MAKSSTSSSSSKAEIVQTCPLGHGRVRTRGGSSRGVIKTRGGSSHRGTQPGLGRGKPMSLVRGGKTCPHLRGNSGSSDIFVTQKKKTSHGPKRKRDTIVIEEPQPSQASQAVELEAETPVSKKARKRVPKKKTPRSDVRYGGPFGGNADFFGWEPLVAEKEKMPCSEGTAKSQPMRTKRMQDMAEVSTPYLMKPSELVIHWEDVQVGYLGRGGCNLTNSTIKFYAFFLAPTRQMVNPHDFVVETARQLQCLQEKFSFEDGKHSNLFRGCLGDIRGFNAWGEHICTRHSEVLEVVGVQGSILATGDGFWRMPDVISAFLGFWSPATNSFLFPFGEMSITLWDLKGICGLPVMGAAFDECTPPGAML